MKQEDTISLLKECNSGSKMAVTSIDDMLGKIKQEKFRNILITCKDKHSKLGNEIHKELMKYGKEEKDPHPMAKSMAKMKTEMKFAMDNSDKMVADLMTEGCSMGIKSLNKYLNQYEMADDKAKSLCQKLIRIEEDCAEDIKCYL